MKQTIAADYAGAGATHDSRGEFMLRARDRRDRDRAVVIHMTYEQMVDARDRLNALIDNPPVWTRAGRERVVEPGCEGHDDDDRALTVGEPYYCDGSCNPKPRADETDDDEDLDACTCVEFCDQDPQTACSLSGTPHVHPELPGRPGIYGPCPVHPERPGDH